MNRKTGFAILILFISSLSGWASQTTYTFYPSGDAHIHGNGHTDENEGASNSLRIQHPDYFSNVLIKFSNDAILAAIGTSHVVSANLQVYIETNYSNWGSGTNVDVYRMAEDWDEMGVTWNCYPSDLNLADTQPSCVDLWGGGYYNDNFSDTLLFQNSSTGWQIFDVTSDVQLFQNGTSDFGWVIRKRDYSAGGAVDFTSLQGTSAQRPKLVVIVDDQSCTPTSVSSVSPLVIPSDGTSQQIVVSGTGIDRVTHVFVDQIAITPISQNASSLTVSVAYSATNTHFLTLTSNCLTDTLDTYAIEADTDLYQNQYSMTHNLDVSPPNSPDAIGSATCSPTGATNFGISSTGQLTWRHTPRKLVAYYSFDPITVNSFYNPVSNIQNYLRNLQLISNADAAISRGVNSVRWQATGYSNSNDGVTTLPWQWGGTGYKIDNTTPLASNYITHLNTILQAAQNNGLIVQLTLFDAVLMEDNWASNPWNSDNNNAMDNDLGINDLKGLSNPFLSVDTNHPGWFAFYKIFKNGDIQQGLSPLGVVEMNYVRNVVHAVQTACNGPCRNVFFEIMNEAPVKSPGNQQYVDRTLFKNWVKTVASWIKGCGAYAVSLSLGLGAPSSPGDPNFTNGELDGFSQGQVGLINLHGGEWYDNSLTKDQNVTNIGLAMSKFHGHWPKKAVMVDDDGVGGFDTTRNKRCNMEAYAAKAIGTAAIGVGHYATLDDVSSLAYVCTPGPLNQSVDCNKIDNLADVGPSRLCGTGWFTCGATLNSCPDPCPSNMNHSCVNN